jgi:hypothetical protein
MEERKGREEKIRFQRSCEFFFSPLEKSPPLSLSFLASLSSLEKKKTSV